MHADQRTGPGRATERDYDRDPDRYRAGMSAAARFGTAGADLYRWIADLLDETPGERREVRVLDLGCGEGPLAAAATGRHRVVGVDASQTMLRGARRHSPVVQGDITRLPFTRGCVDAVVAVNVLDHLDRPASALDEARRVLRPGGRLVVGAISRTDSPELAPQWRPAPTPFDSEDALETLRAAGFTDVHSLPWDGPLVTLPDRDALAAYLRARFLPPQHASDLAAAVIARTGLPLSVTKRGALVVARSP